MKKHLLIISSVFNSCIRLLSFSAYALDLEPRRWTTLPEDTKVSGIGYAHSSGNFDLDPVLQLEETTFSGNAVFLSHVNSFVIGDKKARFDALLPLKDIKWKGLLSGSPASAERTGLGDPRLRLSVNLLDISSPGSNKVGTEPSKPATNTVLGAAIAVTLPLGEYYSDRLLNIGENRFTLRPQVGVVHTYGSWSYELTGSIFYYTDNNDFFNGSTREQEPIYALQAHVVKNFRPGLWASLSAGYGKGGKSKINGIQKNDERRNLLTALSLGIPLSKTQGLKFSYIQSDNQNEIGSDSENIAVSWSVAY